jgi:hypothetical protein
VADVGKYPAMTHLDRTKNPLRLDTWIDSLSQFNFSRTCLLDNSFYDVEPGYVDPSNAKAMLTNIPGRRDPSPLDELSRVCLRSYH